MGSVRIRSVFLVLSLVLSVSSVGAQTVQKLSFSGRVVDSAWITLYAEVDLASSDGTRRIHQYALASGSVNGLVADTFDLADGTRDLSDIQGIFLAVDAATGTPHGTVYWDCLVVEDFKVGYSNPVNPDDFKEIDILQLQPLVPQPNGDKTECSGLRRVRIY